jgi:hypothetical protein
VAEKSGHFWGCPATIDNPPVPQPPSQPEAGFVEVSLYPSVVVSNGTPLQHRRLKQAVVRFRSADLPLPDLGVEFDTDTDARGGHLGLCRTKPMSWQRYTSRHVSETGGDKARNGVTTR